MTKHYHLIALGCQMNKSDSERAAALLDSLGLTQTLRPEEADFILINTCSVRQSAEDRVYGQVKKFNKLKIKKPGLIIGVTGCMPGRDKRGEFFKKMPGLDLYFPISDLPHLPAMLRARNPEIGILEVDPDYLKIAPKHQNKFKAFITIETGCDKYCAYCVVPFARGPVRHRLLSDILVEARALAAGGCLEITLLGQTVNNYIAADAENFNSKNPFKDNFAALLWELNQISGIERIHFTAAHPSHMTDEVIAALALPRQANYLHLPVQSGSNSVLARMNRPYTREEYIEIIKKVRSARPGIAIGTDIIVGFPGETAEEFEETLSLYREIEFDISYNAIYSPRSGTAAVKAYGDDVPREEKEWRWQELENTMREITLRKNQAYAGREVSVLVDSCAAGICRGNSAEMKLVNFSHLGDLTGQIRPVIIEVPKLWILEGKLALINDKKE
ncbi:MAG: tRNA (N6-isopentenyl adenosine(37)-C2)-methylthiotransferase MiaB [Patescibacteria group bacterium]|nr:tRNA (N6-isopentenyl adenosine(37)-C2)-methylthiotransferase MiaB [Patescibacteria group bacterium]